MKFSIAFRNSTHPPVELLGGEELSENLTIENSPVLFGCRTGICGTCLCRVKRGEVPAPEDEEVEVLEILAPGDSEARLACKLKASADIELEYIGK